MDISKTTIGIAATLCVALGAGGAYLATRDGETPAAITEPAPTVSPDPVQLSAVEQSEGVVTETPPAAAPLEKLAPPPAASNRSRERTAGAPVRRDPPQVEESRDQTHAPLIPAPLEPPRLAEHEPVRPSEPPGPVYEDLVISADAVIGLQVESAVSSETARIEDPVVARVMRDVKVGDRVAIPAGSKAHGEVTLVERGGKVRERARLGVRFTSIVLADGTRVPIATEQVLREGDAPSRESSAQIGGGAIGGAIIGGILGGAKGAIIGGSAGAGAGTTAVMMGGRNPATLSAGSPVTVRLEDTATVTVEK